MSNKRKTGIINWAEKRDKKRQQKEQNKEQAYESKAYNYDSPKFEEYYKA